MPSFERYELELSSPPVLDKPCSGAVHCPIGIARLPKNVGDRLVLFFGDGGILLKFTKVCRCGCRFESEADNLRLLSTPIEF